jgi:GT2 family glycosyltransferase
LIDNASQDDSIPFTQQRFPSVEIIASSVNRRWAGGNNLALRRVRDEVLAGEYILLLNNDTVVPQGSLERLVLGLHAEPRAWAATPRICYADDPARAWYDGGSVGSWTGWIRHRGLRQLTGHLATEPSFVDYGTGCALLLGADALVRVGELDESYYFYGEDTDYCLRIRAAGGEILHIPRALVLHKVSAALGSGSPRKAYLRSRSHVQLLRRRWPRRRWPVVAAAQVGYLAALAGWHLWNGRPAAASASVQGVLDELHGLPDPGANGAAGGHDRRADGRLSRPDPS